MSKFQMIYRLANGHVELQPPHSTRECALDSVSLFEGAHVIGIIEVTEHGGITEYFEPELTGMQFAIERNKQRG